MTYSINYKSPLVVGVAGGTGSGKTTVVKRITEALNPQDVVVLQHDSYYRDRSHLPAEERSIINYDHPDSIETILLIKNLEELIAGKCIEVPVYDFALHIRSDETIQVMPADVIILEGILIFNDPGLLSLMDIKIFVDTDDDVRFIRRMERDMKERGRSRESVVNQYLTTVKPMHEKHVEPSKRFADIIIPEGGYNTTVIDILVTKIKHYKQ